MVCRARRRLSITILDKDGTLPSSAMQDAMAAAA